MHLKHISSYITHTNTHTLTYTHTHTRRTQKLSIQNISRVLCASFIRDTSLHSSQDPMAPSFISELMMIPCFFHRLNDTWMSEGDTREGRHVDPPFIENNGANMAPIGSNISQVAVYLSLYLDFLGES